MSDQTRAADMIFKHYGVDNQMLKTVEELGELIRAVGRWQMSVRMKEQDKTRVLMLYDNLIEEIADVEVMLGQLKRHFKISSDVHTIKTAKISRALLRIKEGMRKEKEK